MSSASSIRIPSAQRVNPLLSYGDWIADTASDWPDAARLAARNAFIDTLGVAVPGAVEPVARRAFATVAPWGAGPSAAIGQSARLAAPWAALVNGAAAHALDFDDNFDPAKAHASAVLVPSIMALAEQEGANGAACLDAFIVGLQIMGRVGQGLNPVHRNRGWHATATVGAIGAAAACARLLRLDAQQAAFALSIATSMAAGSMAQFGTMTKPLHAGMAAKAGVMAASFARAGIDAGLQTLDGPTGINRLMVGPDLEQQRAKLTHIEHGQTLTFETEQVGTPLLILSSGLKVKRFPNCGSAHRAMDGLLALRDEQGFAADQIAEVRVHAPASHLANLMYQRPQTPAEAKFSLEFALALIAVRGRCNLADFDEATLADPAITAVYPRVRRIPVDKGEGEFPTHVEVSLDSGKTFAIDVAMPAGSLAAPFTEAQRWTKFDASTAGLIASADLAILHESLARMNDLDTLTPLTDALARTGQQSAGIAR